MTITKQTTALFCAMIFSACGGGTNSMEEMDLAIEGSDLANATDGGTTVNCPGGGTAPVTPAAASTGHVFGTWHVIKHRSGNVDSDPSSDCDQNIAYNIGLVIQAPGDYSTDAACAIAKGSSHTIELPFSGGSVDVITNQSCIVLSCAGNDKFKLLWNSDIDQGQIFIENSPGNKTLWATITKEGEGKLFLGTPFNWVLGPSGGIHCTQ